MRADHNHPVHDLINEAERLARYLRVMTGGDLTLAVVRNIPPAGPTAGRHAQLRTAEARQGLPWGEAHEVAEQRAKMAGVPMDEGTQAMADAEKWADSHDPADDGPWESAGMHKIKVRIRGIGKPKTLTYQTARDVAVNDTVEVPRWPDLPPGPPLRGTVVELGSDREGPLVTIVGG